MISDDNIYFETVMNLFFRLNRHSMCSYNNVKQIHLYMKSCKHFIISNSSYGAMAAILANQEGKKVISPSGYNWFGDCAGINGNDIMQDDWIQIRFEKRRAA